MPLHLIKLCVGADSLQDLRDWVAQRSLTAMAAGLEPHSVHTTRMIPKRVEELLEDRSCSISVLSRETTVFRAAISFSDPR
jgi:hypothetical protein